MPCCLPGRCLHSPTPPVFTTCALQDVYVAVLRAASVRAGITVPSVGRITPDRPPLPPAYPGPDFFSHALPAADVKCGPTTRYVDRFRRLITPAALTIYRTSARYACLSPHFCRIPYPPTPAFILFFCLACHLTMLCGCDLLRSPLTAYRVTVTNANTFLTLLMIPNGHRRWRCYRRFYYRTHLCLPVCLGDAAPRSGQPGVVPFTIQDWLTSLTGHGAP